MENRRAPQNPLEATRQLLLRFLTLLSGPDTGKAPVKPLKISQLPEHGNPSLADQAAKRKAQNSK